MALGAVAWYAQNSGRTSPAGSDTNSIAGQPLVPTSLDSKGAAWPKGTNPPLPVSAKVLTDATGIKLVRVEPGTFTMGLDDGSGDEGPAHPVTISRAFYLGECEVTQGQYQQIRNNNPSHFHGSDSLPVETVSWFDAVEFCNALSEHEKLAPYYRIEEIGGHHNVTIPDSNGTGYRLPTEAEWEYACRSGNTAKYGFSDDLASLAEFAWFDENAEKTTHPVGEKPANRFALHDMQGNVREWCWDRYDKDYYKQKNEIDPIVSGQAGGNLLHVHRGGSWDSAAPLVRPSVRGKLPATEKGQYFGFRVARNVW